MPKKHKPRYDYTWEDYLEIKRKNKESLDRIFATPNYQEVYGKKWYGDNWRATLYGNHPEREAKKMENNQRAYKRKKGEYVEEYVPYIQRKICKYDLEGNFIECFDSALVWAEREGKERKHASQIVKVARDDSKGSAYGYIWKIDC